MKAQAISTPASFMCDCTFSLSPFTALYVRHLRHRRLKRHQQSYPRFVRQNQICLPGLRRSSRTGRGRSTSPRAGRVRASGRCGGRGDGRRSRCTGCPGVYQRAQVPDSRSVTSRRTEPRTVRKIGNFRESRAVPRDFFRQAGLVVLEVNAGFWQTSCGGTQSLRSFGPPIIYFVLLRRTCIQRAPPTSRGRGLATSAARCLPEPLSPAGVWIGQARQG